MKTHLSHIYAKLGVANRTELATTAARRGDSPSLTAAHDTPPKPALRSS